MALAAVAALAAPQVGSAETVPLPAGASSTVPAPGSLEAVACPSVGACAAGGWYLDSANDQQALAETENGGVWTAAKVDLSGVSPNSDPYAELQQVACPSAGNCVAVGDYEDSTHTQQGMIATQSGGSWTATKVNLSPAGGGSNPQVDFSGLECTAVGDCVAVGMYVDSASTQQGLILTETGGTWTASSATLAGVTVSPSNPDVYLSSISCPDAGDCVAVGSYWDPSNHSQALMLVESNGAWTAHEADLSKLPGVASNPAAVLSSVSCASAGNCTAVGSYTDASANRGSHQGLLVSETAGVWSAASEATLPANAYTTGTSGQAAQSDLALRVSCSSAGNCGAVGSYDAGTLTGDQGMTLTQSGGVWSSATEVTLPVAGAANPRVQLDAVTCGSAAGCVASGGYVSSGGAYEALVLDGASSGTWIAAATPVLVQAQATLGAAQVSCSQSGYCAAAGNAPSGGSAGVSPFLLDAPSAVTAPVVTLSKTNANKTNANVSWGTPADDGGLPLTGYTVMANDLTSPARGGQTVTTNTSIMGATFPHLATGDTYTFTVTASGPLGLGLSATTASVTLPPSKQQISTSLAALLAPKGSASRLKKLRRTHAYTFRYRPLESGKLSVRWYEATGRGKQRHRHLFASGSVTTNGTKAAKLKVRLTAFGQHAASSARRLPLSASVTFTGGGVSVTRIRKFTLH